MRAFDAAPVLRFGQAGRVGPASGRERGVAPSSLAPRAEAAPDQQARHESIDYDSIAYSRTP